MRQNIYRNNTSIPQNYLTFLRLWEECSSNSHIQILIFSRCRRYPHVKESARQISLVNCIFSDPVTFHPSSILHYGAEEERRREVKPPTSKTEHWLLEIFSTSENYGDEALNSLKE